jgi:hypothetical protein
MISTIDYSFLMKTNDRIPVIHHDKSTIIAKNLAATTVIRSNPFLIFNDGETLENHLDIILGFK